MGERAGDQRQGDAARSRSWTTPTSCAGWIGRAFKSALRLTPKAPKAKPASKAKAPGPESSKAEGGASAEGQAAQKGAHAQAGVPSREDAGSTLSERARGAPALHACRFESSLQLAHPEQGADCRRQRRDEERRRDDRERGKKGSLRRCFRSLLTCFRSFVLMCRMSCLRSKTAHARARSSASRRSGEPRAAGLLSFPPLAALGGQWMACFKLLIAWCVRSCDGSTSRSTKARAVGSSL